MVRRLSALPLLEREKVATNAKFEEVGLDVSVNRMLGPRVVVQGVHAEISHRNNYSG